MTLSTFLKTFLFISFIVYVNSLAAQCGVDPSGGTTTITTANNIVNSYYPGTLNAAAGTNNIVVGVKDVRSAGSNIAAGDLILIMQMQGADLNTSNSDSYGNGIAGAPANGSLAINLYAGYYEYADVAAMAAGTITLSNSLRNSYYARSFTATTGVRNFQVIRVPRTYNLDVTAAGSVTAPVWNESTGGVVVLNAANLLTVNGVITASGAGFPGGGGKNFDGATTGNTNGTSTLANSDYRWNAAATTPANTTGGAKGGSIAGAPAYIYVSGTVVTTIAEAYIDGSMGRGAPANGGGGGTDGAPVGTAQNQYNTGGGGGANSGDGGNGGSGWHGGSGSVTTYPYGGYGGKSFSAQVVQRIIMGGGGGAGTCNNSTAANTEYQSSGGAGGGIVLIRAKSYSGSGSVLADGNDAPDVTITASTDAAGGGGSGGTIVLITFQNGITGLGGITASVKGGQGGNMETYYDHGPGGGGGGGVIYTNGTLASAVVAGGLNGKTRTGAINGPLDNDFGATVGGAGSVVIFSTPPALSGTCGVLPVNMVNFLASVKAGRVDLKWTVTDAVNLQSFIIQRGETGYSFNDIGVIPYLTTASNYLLTDAQPFPVSYYRLKMVNRDGSFTYSRNIIVRLNTPDVKRLIIYPNPVKQDITLRLNWSLDEPVMLQLIDATGRKVFNRSVVVQKGVNFILLGIGHLAPGNYILMVGSGADRLTEKLIVNQ